MSLTLTEATTAQDYDAIKQLFREYQTALGVDLCFQGFGTELENLKLKYDVLLLAYWDGAVCGCVGMWPLTADQTCEMKRLYVRDQFKGKGIGKILAQTILDKARARGFKTMRLDTLAHLKAALSLYSQLGFKACDPYYTNPLDNVVYLEKSL
ncbi:GNAT family N-acetyltransferase [Terasakiella pusilla]|uniref:GNAT family N-acetyltransferase n=1 Tax=Terasakiella pusilla TaxID=64973 RepID=UPI003AA9B75A